MSMVSYPRRQQQQQKLHGHYQLTLIILQALIYNYDDDGDCNVSIQNTKQKAFCWCKWSCLPSWTSIVVPVLHSGAKGQCRQWAVLAIYRGIVSCNICMIIVASQMLAGWVACIHCELCCNFAEGWGTNEARPIPVYSNFVDTDSQTDQHFMILTLQLVLWCYQLKLESRAHDPTMVALASACVMIPAAKSLIMISLWCH